MSAVGGAGEGGRSAGPSLLRAWGGFPADAWARRLGVATVEFHARVASTSDRARTLAAEGWPRPAVVVADRQSAGRGRRGRRWVSDTPLGLWFTVVADPVAGGAAGLPLRVGLGVARGLECLVPDVRIGIRWPNDLMIEGGKLGGVLCEETGCAVLAGIGLNLNHAHDDLPGGLETAATSVLAAARVRVSRARVLASVIDELSGVWAHPGPPIPAVELAELNARSPLRGSRLSAEGAVRRSSGPPRAVRGLRVTGGDILPDGALEVRDDAGTLLRMIAGSVRSNPETPGS